MGSGPICTIIQNGERIFCWHMADTNYKLGSFHLQIEGVLFVSVKVAADVWALSLSGQLFVWPFSGSLFDGATPVFNSAGTSFGPYSSAVYNYTHNFANEERPGVLPGRFKAFDVYAYTPARMAGGNWRYQRIFCGITSCNDIYCGLFETRRDGFAGLEMDSISSKYYPLRPIVTTILKSYHDPFNCEMPRETEYSSMSFLSMLPNSYVTPDDSATPQEGGSLSFSNIAIIARSTETPAKTYIFGVFGRKFNNYLEPIEDNHRLDEMYSFAAGDLKFSSIYRCTPAARSILNNFCDFRLFVFASTETTNYLRFQILEDNLDTYYGLDYKTTELFGGVHVGQIVTSEGGIICAIVHPNSNAQLGCIDVHKISDDMQTVGAMKWPTTQVLTLPTWLRNRGSPPIPTLWSHNSKQLSLSSSAACVLQGSVSDGGHVYPDCIVLGSDKNKKFIAGTPFWPLGRISLDDAKVVPKSTGYLGANEVESHLVSTHSGNVFCLKLKTYVGSIYQDSLTERHGVRCFGDDPIQINAIHKPHTNWDLIPDNFLVEHTDRQFIRWTGVNGVVCGINPAKNTVCFGANSTAVENVLTNVGALALIPHPTNSTVQIFYVTGSPPQPKSTTPMVGFSGMPSNEKYLWDVACSSCWCCAILHENQGNDKHFVRCWQVNSGHCEGAFLSLYAAAQYVPQTLRNYERKGNSNSPIKLELNEAFYGIDGGHQIVCVGVKKPEDDPTWSCISENDITGATLMERIDINLPALKSAKVIRIGAFYICGIMQSNSVGCITVTSGVVPSLPPHYTSNTFESISISGTLMCATTSDKVYCHNLTGSSGSSVSRIFGSRQLGVEKPGFITGYLAESQTVRVVRVDTGHTSGVPCSSPTGNTITCNSFSAALDNMKRASTVYKLVILGTVFDDRSNPEPLTLMKNLQIDGADGELVLNKPLVLSLIDVFVYNLSVKCAVSFSLSVTTCIQLFATNVVFENVNLHLETETHPVDYLATAVSFKAADHSSLQSVFLKSILGHIENGLLFYVEGADKVTVRNVTVAMNPDHFCANGHFLHYKYGQELVVNQVIAHMLISGNTHGSTCTTHSLILPDGSFTFTNIGPFLTVEQVHNIHVSEIQLSNIYAFYGGAAILGVFPSPDQTVTVSDITASDVFAGALGIIAIISTTDAITLDISNVDISSTLPSNVWSRGPLLKLNGLVGTSEGASCVVNLHNILSNAMYNDFLNIAKCGTVHFEDSELSFPLDVTEKLSEYFIFDTIQELNVQNVTFTSTQLDYDSVFHLNDVKIAQFGNNLFTIMGGCSKFLSFLFTPRIENMSIHNDTSLLISHGPAKLTFTDMTMQASCSNGIYASPQDRDTVDLSNTLAVVGVVIHVLNSSWVSSAPGPGSIISLNLDTSAVLVPGRMHIRNTTLDASNSQYIRPVQFQAIRDPLHEMFLKHSQVHHNELLIEESSFLSGSVGPDRGGAVYASNVQVHIEKSKFTSKAQLEGGAIYLDNASLSGQGMDFHSAAKRGGAIYATDCSGVGIDIFGNNVYSQVSLHPFPQTGNCLRASDHLYNRFSSGAEVGSAVFAQRCKVYMRYALLEGQHCTGSTTACYMLHLEEVGPSSGIGAILSISNPSHANKSFFLKLVDPVSNFVISDFNTSPNSVGAWMYDILRGFADCYYPHASIESLREAIKFPAMNLQNSPSPANDATCLGGGTFDKMRFSIVIAQDENILFDAPLVSVSFHSGSQVGVSMMNLYLITTHTFRTVFAFENVENLTIDNLAMQDVTITSNTDVSFFNAGSILAIVGSEYLSLTNFYACRSNVTGFIVSYQVADASSPTASLSNLYSSLLSSPHLPAAFIFSNKNPISCTNCMFQGTPASHLIQYLPSAVKFPILSSFYTDVVIGGATVNVMEIDSGVVVTNTFGPISMEGLLLGNENFVENYYCIVFATSGIDGRKLTSTLLGAYFLLGNEIFLSSFFIRGPTDVLHTLHLECFDEYDQHFSSDTKPLILRTSTLTVVGSTIESRLIPHGTSTRLPLNITLQFSNLVIPSAPSCRAMVDNAFNSDGLPIQHGLEYNNTQVNIGPDRIEYFTATRPLCGGTIDIFIECALSNEVWQTPIIPTHTNQYEVLVLVEHNISLCGLTGLEEPYCKPDSLAPYKLSPQGFIYAEMSTIPGKFYSFLLPGRKFTSLPNSPLTGPNSFVLGAPDKHMKHDFQRNIQFAIFEPVFVDGELDSYIHSDHFLHPKCTIGINNTPHSDYSTMFPDHLVSYNSEAISSVMTISADYLSFVNAQVRSTDYNALVPLEVVCHGICENPVKSGTLIYRTPDYQDSFEMQATPGPFQSRYFFRGEDAAANIYARFPFLTEPPGVARSCEIVLTESSSPLRTYSIEYFPTEPDPHDGKVRFSDLFGNYIPSHPIQLRMQCVFNESISATFLPAEQLTPFLPIVNVASTLPAIVHSSSKLGDKPSLSEVSALLQYCLEPTCTVGTILHIEANWWCRLTVNSETVRPAETAEYYYSAVSITPQGIPQVNFVNVRIFGTPLDRFSLSVCCVAPFLAEEVCSVPSVHTFAEYTLNVVDSPASMYPHYPGALYEDTPSITVSFTVSDGVQAPSPHEATGFCTLLPSVSEIPPEYSSFMIVVNEEEFIIHFSQTSQVVFERLAFSTPPNVKFYIQVRCVVDDDVVVWANVPPITVLPLELNFSASNFLHLGSHMHFLPFGEMREVILQYQGNTQVYNVTTFPYSCFLTKDNSQSHKLSDTLSPEMSYDEGFLFPRSIAEFPPMSSKIFLACYWSNIDSYVHYEIAVTKVVSLVLSHSLPASTLGNTLGDNTLQKVTLGVSLYLTDDSLLDPGISGIEWFCSVHASNSTSTLLFEDGRDYDFPIFPDVSTFRTTIEIMLFGDAEDTISLLTQCKYQDYVLEFGGASDSVFDNVVLHVIEEPIVLFPIPPGNFTGSVTPLTYYSQRQGLTTGGASPLYVQGIYPLSDCQYSFLPNSPEFSGRLILREPLILPHPSFPTEFVRTVELFAIGNAYSKGRILVTCILGGETIESSTDEVTIAKPALEFTSVPIHILSSELGTDSNLFPMSVSARLVYMVSESAPSVPLLHVPATCNLRLTDKLGKLQPPVGVCTSKVNPVDGSIIFSNCGAQLHKIEMVKLQLECLLPNGEVLLVIRNDIPVMNYSLSIQQQPSETIFSSGWDEASAFFPFSPHPAVKIELSNVPTHSYNNPPYPYSNMGTLYCTVSSGGFANYQGTIRLLGDLVAPINPTTGMCTFTNLGVLGTFGAIGKLIFTCQLPNGMSSMVESQTFSIASIGVDLAFPLLMVPLSGNTLDEFVLVTEVLEVSVYGLISSSKVTPAGLPIPCSMDAILSETSLEGSFVNLVNAEDVVWDDMNGGGFTNFGLFGTPGALVRLRVQCTWPSGQTFSGNTDTLILIPLLAQVVQEPQLSIVSSGYEASTFDSASTPFVVRINSIIYSSLAMTSYTLVPYTQLPLTCSLMPIVVDPGSLEEVLIVQGASKQSDPLTGVVTFDNFAVIGSFGVQFILQVNCLTPIGSVFSTESRVISIASFKGVFSSVPDEVVASSGIDSMVPFQTLPRFTLYIQAPDSQFVATSDLVACEVGAVSSVSNVYLVGDLQYTIPADTNDFDFRNVGVHGVFGATFQLEVICMWKSEETMQFLSPASITILTPTLTFLTPGPWHILPSNDQREFFQSMDPLEITIVYTIDGTPQTTNDVGDSAEWSCITTVDPSVSPSIARLSEQGSTVGVFVPALSIWRFDQLGFDAVNSEVFRLLVMCSSFAGTLSELSGEVEISTFSLHATTALPQTVVRTSLADAGTNSNVLIPSPQVQFRWSHFDPHSAATPPDIVTSPWTFFPFRCSASVGAAYFGGQPISTSQVRLIGVSMPVMNATGHLTWDSIAISALPGTQVILRYSCISFRGTITLDSTPIEVVQLQVGFISQPSAEVVPIASLSNQVPGLTVIAPFQLGYYGADTALGDPILSPASTCTLSVVSDTITNIPLSLLGTTAVAVDSQTGFSDFSDISISGPSDTFVKLVAYCQLSATSVVTAQSNPIYLSPLRLVIMQQPPTYTIPSTEDDQTWSHAPQLRVEYRDVQSDSWISVESLAADMVCTASIDDYSYGSTVTLKQLQLQGDIQETADSTGVVTFSNISTRGLFDAWFFLVVTCVWQTGESLTVQSDEIMHILPILSWSTTLPPEYFLHNYEMDEFVIDIGYKTSPTDAIIHRDWSGFGEIQVKCEFDVLFATVVVDPNNVAFDLAIGELSFRDMLIIPLVPNTSDAMYDLSVTCQILGIAVEQTLEMTLPLYVLNATFSQSPDEAILPSSEDMLVPLPIVIQIQYDQDNIFVADAIECVMTFGTGTDISMVAFVGDNIGTTTNGELEFTSLGIRAPLDTTLSIYPSCYSERGAYISYNELTLRTDPVSVSWVVKPPAYILAYETAKVTVMVSRTTEFCAGDESPLGDDPEGTCTPMTTTDPVSSVQCSANIYEAREQNGSSAVAQFVTFSSSVTDATGLASISFSLTARNSVKVSIEVRCTVAVQEIHTPLVVVEIDRAYPVFHVAPPDSWLPSFGLSRVFLPQTPTVFLKRLSDNSVIDSRRTVCSVSVESDESNDVGILEHPIEGFRLKLPLGISDSSPISDPIVADYVLNTPIELTNLLVRGPFGVHVNLRISCVRRNTDYSLSLYHPMKLKAVAMRWKVYLPQFVLSHTIFSLSLELYDHDLQTELLLQRGAYVDNNYGLPPDAVPYGLRNLALVQDSQASSIIQEADGSMRRLSDLHALPVLNGAIHPNFLPEDIRNATLLNMDNVSTCQIHVDANAPGVGTMNYQAVASGGVVEWRGPMLMGRAGSIVNGHITCRIGQIYSRFPLEWSTQMQPCSIGQAPLGDFGYTCGVCETGTYSDGGPDARCIRCPSIGVSCFNGELEFLPGYYRTPDERDTVDEFTEFRHCWISTACEVNTNTMNRTHAQTHRCATGYTGPFCGVCDEKNKYTKIGLTCHKCLPTAFNWFVTLLFPLLFLAFTYWIGIIREQKESSRASPIFRMITTYIQITGVVGTVYLAKGTEKFRELFGFSDVVGTSIFTAGPIQCTLGLQFLPKFLMTIGLPIIIAMTSIMVTIVVIAWIQHRTRRPIDPLDADRVEVVENIVYTTNVMSLRNVPNEKVQKDKEEEEVFALQRTPSVLEVEAQQIKGFRAHTAHYIRSLRWVAPIIFVLNLFYSSITSTLFSVFNCHPVSVGGKTFLTVDLKVECGTPMHKLLQIASGVIIVMFVVGIPIMFAILMKKAENQLHTQKVFSRFGFLYDGYSIERKLYFWETLSMSRKALVTLIGSLIKDMWYQIITSVSFLIIALLLQSIYNPYRLRFHNLLETFAISGIIGTQLISIFYLRFEALIQPCAGASFSHVVDSFGTTCETMLKRKDIGDTWTTIALLILNLIVIATLTISFLRVLYRQTVERNTYTLYRLSRSKIFRFFCSCCVRKCAELARLHKDRKLLVLQDECGTEESIMRTKIRDALEHMDEAQRDAFLAMHGKSAGIKLTRKQRALSIRFQKGELKNFEDLHKAALSGKLYDEPVKKNPFHDKSAFSVNPLFRSKMKNKKHPILHTTKPEPMNPVAPPRNTIASIIPAYTPRSVTPISAQSHTPLALNTPLGDTTPREHDAFFLSRPSSLVPLSEDLADMHRSRNNSSAGQDTLTSTSIGSERSSLSECPQYYSNSSRASLESAIGGIGAAFSTLEPTPLTPPPVLSQEGTGLTYNIDEQVPRSHINTQGLPIASDSEECFTGTVEDEKELGIRKTTVLVASSPSFTMQEHRKSLMDPSQLKEKETKFFSPSRRPILSSIRVTQPKDLAAALDQMSKNDTVKQVPTFNPHTQTAQLDSNERSDSSPSPPTHLPGQALSKLNPMRVIPIRELQGSTASFSPKADYVISPSTPTIQRPVMASNNDLPPNADSVRKTLRQGKLAVNPLNTALQISQQKAEPQAPKSKLGSIISTFNNRATLAKSGPTFSVEPVRSEKYETFTADAKNALLSRGLVSRSAFRREFESDKASPAGYSTVNSFSHQGTPKKGDVEPGLTPDISKLRRLDYSDSEC